MAYNAAAAPTVLLLDITSADRSLCLLAGLKVGAGTCEDEGENVNGGETRIGAVSSTSRGGTRTIEGSAWGLGDGSEPGGWEVLIR